MSLFVFSENGSSCNICLPFEGEVFTDGDNEGYEACDSVESGGAFHDGCEHQWEPVGAEEAAIHAEDRLLARGTEWDEKGHISDFASNPGYQARWDTHLNSINGLIDANARASLRSYTSTGYTRINRVLRHGTGNSQAIGNMDRAMSRSFLKQDMTFYRGTNSGSLDRDLLERVLGRRPASSYGSSGYSEGELQQLVGETFTDRGYFSTSAFKGNSFGGSARYDIEIVSPKGTRGVWVGPEGGSDAASGYFPGAISGVPREAEFIIDRSSEFRIVKVSRGVGERIQLKVVVRQSAQDPVARALAQKAEARAAKAAAKKAGAQVMPTPTTVTGPVPSPTSVAKGLEKLGTKYNPDYIEVQAAWTAPDQMAIKVINKNTGQILEDEVVTVSKAEAKAAKALGDGFQAVKYEQAAPVTAAPTTAAGGTTATGKVPASEVKKLLNDLGMTKGQLAKAVGKSPSLISEWTGGGHGNLLKQSAFPDVKSKALAWVKSQP